MMNICKPVFYASALLLSTAMWAQSNDPVLLSIDGKPTTKSEFESVYHKNNGKDMSAEKKSVQDYLNLFINFKLKVKEAEQMGLDTLPSFKQELNGYRKQLAAPYLTDKEATDKLIQEAYQRMQTEVKASHILVKCNEDALPKDTMEAWHRMNIILDVAQGKSVPASQINEYETLVRKNTFANKRYTKQDSLDANSKIATIKNLVNAATKGGDAFAKAASLISDDVALKDVGGSLGYFTALEMVYPFENAAYSTKVGEISKIVRTRFGYHILKVYDQRPNTGEILVSHIMIKMNKEMKHDDSLKAKQKIDAVYDKLKAGEKFETLAKNYSEDKQTSANGGELNWFAERKFPIEEFAKQAFALQKNEEYTKPFTTRFGWHIVIRKDRRTLPTYEAMKNELKGKIAKDSRSYQSKESFVAKLKKEYNFKEYPKEKEAIHKAIDSTYFQGTWKAKDKFKKAKIATDKYIFTLKNNKEVVNYGVLDFGDYLETHQTRRAKIDVASVVNAQYHAYIDDRLIAYEETQLEKKYPDYRALLEEYRDGILLFDLTDKKVWSKAVKDSAGLEKYYENNKTNYMWGERAEVSTYKCANEKVAKELNKMLAAKKTEKEILDKLNKKNALDISVENVTYLKGENKEADANWKGGSKTEAKQADGRVYVVLVNKILPQTPKKLAECRGMVTSDYQNYLEKEWISNLRSNHKIDVNQNVLSTVK
ncbi:MAG: peptidylprolyl isomerase [Bacteroidetes bacterium]|nr:peptidylprolyl isomerase [Bacteroidota bacterium]